MSRNNPIETRIMCHLSVSSKYTLLRKLMDTERKDLKMKSFIAKNLNVSLGEAFKIQKKYFVDNGTTLRGLMLYHNVQPEEFLNYVHKIDLTSIKKNKEFD